MSRHRLVAYALLIPLAMPISGFAGEDGMRHVRMLRDAYQKFGERLDVGEMRVSVFHPDSGLRRQVHAIWQKGNEYVQVREFEPTAATAGADTDRQPTYVVTNIVGPEGTLVFYNPTVGTPSVHLSRGERKPQLDGTAATIPEPHVAWYQQTWGGQTPWLTVLDMLAHKEIPADVTAKEMPNSTVQLTITNQRNAFTWQVTYAVDRGLRIVNSGPVGGPPTSVYDWEQGADEKWFLRRYRTWINRSVSDDYQSREPFVIQVDAFDYSPGISEGRFLFSSIALPDGTVMMQTTSDSNRIQSEVLGAGTGPEEFSLNDYRRWGQLLRQQGFGRRPDAP